MNKQTDLILIGEQIRKIRKEKGFSQEGFANFIEMNRGYYGTVERGEANVTVLNLLRILKGLDVTPDELFPPATYSAKEKNWGVIYRILPFNSSLSFHLFFIRNMYGTSLTWDAVKGTQIVRLSSPWYSLSLPISPSYKRYLLLKPSLLLMECLPY